MCGGGSLDISNLKVNNNTELGHGYNWTLGASDNNVCVTKTGDLVAGKLKGDGLTAPKFSDGGTISNWGTYMTVDGRIGACTSIAISDGSNNGGNPWDKNGFIVPNLNIDGKGNLDTNGNIKIKKSSGTLTIGNQVLTEALIAKLKAL